MSNIVKKKAIDVTPHNHLLPCYIEDVYHEVEIALRGWTDDGKRIRFMLETHNFFSAAPDEEVEVIEYEPKYCVPDYQERDAKRMANRPTKIVPEESVATLKARIAELEAKLSNETVEDLPGPVVQRVGQLVMELDKLRAVCLEQAEYAMEWACEYPECTDAGNALRCIERALRSALGDALP